MSQSLEQAFRRTKYVVPLPNEHTAIVEIGRRHPDLDAWVADYELSTWCFITAWNPGAVQRERRENARANVSLYTAIQADGHPTVSATARPDAADWPNEPGFVVLGLSAEQALAYAREFGQRAVVFAETGAEAKLLWVDGKND